MQTFKLILKLFKSHKGPILMLFALFMGISIFISDVNSSKGADKFSATKLQIGIVDEGDGTISALLKEYFKEEHELKDLSYDEKEIVNELYWKGIDYALMIPDGADEKLFKDGEDIELKCMKVPGCSANGLFETEVQMYLFKMKSLLTNGFTIEEAEHKLLTLKEEETEVIMAQEVNENKADRLSRYLIYVPYLFIAVCVEGIGFILLIINQKEVKERVECSSNSMRAHLSGISCGILLFGGFVYVVVFVVGALISRGSMFTDPRLPFFLLNCFALLLFSLSLGFLVGVVAKSKLDINGYQNILALPLSFLGGVFVPLEVLGENAHRVGRLLPTYWYVVSTNLISGVVEITDQFRKEIFINTIYILSYAIAVFGLALVIYNLKRNAKK